MTPQFAEWASWELDKLKQQGTSEQDGARWLEQECGRKGQEFHPEGPGIVKTVYGAEGSLETRAEETPDDLPEPKKAAKKK